MNRKIILRITGLLLLLVFVSVTLSFTTIERKQIVCNHIRVTFEEPYQFITPKSIEKLINRKFSKLHGVLLKDLNTEIIETEIEKNPWVKEAEVFKGYNRTDSLYLSGGITVHIVQEKPLLRVADGENSYYVTEDLNRMPVSSSHTTNVIVVTGHTSKAYINDDLVNFIRFINDDKFWKAQIQQIHIRENHEYVLVPRVGDQLIVFGKPEKLEMRFRNLKALYTKGFSSEGWRKYKTINLKYDNQVVCTLR